MLVLQRIPFLTPRKKKTKIGSEANQKRESSGSLSGTTNEMARRKVNAPNIIYEVALMLI